MTETRTYRGLTAAMRQAERRDRLMEAGLELFATVGYANTSIRTVCATASLNSRYFYESFDSKEDLLYRLYEHIVLDSFMRTREAVAKEDTIPDKARAGLRAGWTAVTDDPRRARIVAVEAVGASERLERFRRETRHALAKLMADEALSLAREDVRFRLDPDLTARFLMGGVVETLLDWANGDVHASTDEIVEHFTTIFTAATYAAVDTVTSEQDRGEV